jgi:hypothetical protein
LPELAAAASRVVTHNIELDLPASVANVPHVVAGATDLDETVVLDRAVDELRRVAVAWRAGVHREVAAEFGRDDVLDLDRRGVDLLATVRANPHGASSWQVGIGWTRSRTWLERHLRLRLRR